jgi:curved DNA-binding protein CbpA
VRVTSGHLDLYRILQVDPAAQPAVILAAYRALARMWHPDQTGSDTGGAMALINRAYAVLRDPEQRGVYDRERASGATSPATVPIRTPPPADARRPAAAPDRSAGGTVLTHGRYKGWTLEQLVRHDPDYLGWLARHTSGRHHRPEIDRLLARRPAPVAARRR